MIGQSLRLWSLQTSREPRIALQIFFSLLRRTKGNLGYPIEKRKISRLWYITLTRNFSSWASGTVDFHLQEVRPTVEILCPLDL
jgi:hypothetical protein